MGCGPAPPGYVHLRRLIKHERARRAVERARREEIRGILEEAASRVIVGRFFDPYHVAERIREAGAAR